MLFDVQTSLRGRFSVLRVVGDVDMSTLPALRSAVEDLSGPHRALDLSSVDYFDPVCLGILIAAKFRADQSRATFVVVAGPPVQELLNRSGLDQLLGVVGSFPD